MTRRIKILLTMLCVVIAALFLWHPVTSMVKSTETKDKKQKEGKKKKNQEGVSDQGSENIRIINKWELPDELLEVSGIVWLDNNRFACVQDEEGTVFIFNSSTSE